MFKNNFFDVSTRSDLRDIKKREIVHFGTDRFQKNKTINKMISGLKLTPKSAQKMSTYRSNMFKNVICWFKVIMNVNKSENRDTVPVKICLQSKIRLLKLILNQ